MTASQKRGGGGTVATVQAFNFVRRIGFPSTPEIISIFTTLVVFSTSASLPSMGIGLATTLSAAFGLVIFPSVAGELVNASLLLRGDPVLNFRRLMAMELLSWSTLALVLPVSAIIGQLLVKGSVWGYGFLLALAFSLPLRTLTIFAISPMSSTRKLVAVSLAPLITLAVYVGSDSFGNPSGGHALGALLLLGFQLPLSILWVSKIIRVVENSGTVQIGDSPMSLFRLFLQHWLKKDPKPLEDRLGLLGSKSNIRTSILAFDARGHFAGACIVVSNYHPGPYRDLGSAGLPSTLKFALETSARALALVPHGISSHQNNIISRQDIEKMVTTVKQSYPSTFRIGTASRIIRTSVGEASASAQAFGDVALVTLTLAPSDMEDVPEEVSQSLRATAHSLGLTAVIVDAHNSLSTQTSITPEQSRRLTEAANNALNQVSLLPQATFKVGVAQDPLHEFALEDGIGPGGLSVLAVEVQGKLAAYLTIDGNNMEKGFRDKILAALKDEGVDEGEVMTTDTHLVTGLVRSDLGYHPVGEHLDRILLIELIKNAFLQAKKNMEEARAGFSVVELELLVLGSATFESTISFVSNITGKISNSFAKLELAILVLASLIIALV